MSDSSVEEALRSTHKLVVVEAPAGSGKTFQGAEYARAAANQLARGRVLILAHTHAACDVFAERTRGQARAEIRTIDALTCAIASAYHKAIGLPADASAWARSQKNGYELVAAKVAMLLNASPLIPTSLAKRYPIVVCDEHQDASPDQHALVAALEKHGALVRIFGDPMQRIYGRLSDKLIVAELERWESLKKRAVAEKLDFPHRWSPERESFGHWLLSARETLRTGRKIVLKGLPPGVRIVVAENTATKYGAFATGTAEAKAIYSLARELDSLLVLTSNNASADGLRSFFGRALPVWEGHVRVSLDALVASLADAAGAADKVAAATIRFVQDVAKGFSDSAFANKLRAEVASGCSVARRGMPQKLQALARLLLEQPTHQGVAAFLKKLHDLKASDPAFASLAIDYPREFWDAVHLEKFESASEGLSEITRRRTYARPKLPVKAISTIHKAKGHECHHVIVMPCDGQTFPDKPGARCLLYVAMSRATDSLTLVLSRTNPSPLLELS